MRTIRRNLLLSAALLGALSIATTMECVAQLACIGSPPLRSEKGPYRVPGYQLTSEELDTWLTQLRTTCTWGATADPLPQYVLRLDADGLYSGVGSCSPGEAVTATNAGAAPTCSPIVTSDDQTAAEVPYDHTASGLAAVDVQAALDEILGDAVLWGGVSGGQTVNGGTASAGVLELRANTVDADTGARIRLRGSTAIANPGHLMFDATQFDFTGGDLVLSSGGLVGNATTAYAFAADPGACAPSQFALDQDADGTLTCAQVSFADILGTIDPAQLPAATTSTQGAVVLATPSSDTAAGHAVQASDARMSDARTPTAHTHPASEISDSTTAGRAVLTAADAAAQRTALGLGTAATHDVPSSGDAGATQAVLGSDSRLADTRTPSSTLAHASTHASGQSDALSGTLAVDISGNAATATTATTAGGAPPTGAAGGGLTGTYPNPTVASVPASALPNPSSSTLGGVQSLAVVSHKWINTISTSGVPAATQPACSDLSDAAASCATAPTASSIGLGSVTNDAQTKASVVPNTAPAAGRLLVGNAGGTAYAPVAASGSCTVASTGVFTCTDNDTGATGTVAVAHGGTGTTSTLTGLVRGNSSAMTAAELSGDATTSGSNAVSVVKVNGSTPGGTCSAQFVRSLNSSAVPTCASVVEADQSLSDNTTGNASTSAHGYLKKLDGTATHYMDGSGAWSTPAGADNVQMGRPSAGGTTYFSLPGVDANGALTTHALSANTIYYYPFWVGTTITIDRIAVGTTLEAASGKKLRLCIYNADVNLEPGALVVDGGEVNAATSAPAHLEVTVSKQLAAGRYLFAVWGDGTETMRSVFSMVGYSTNVSNNTVVASLTKGATYTSGGTSTCADPGTAWDTVSLAASGFLNDVKVRILTP